jgi:hypothetical protein
MKARLLVVARCPLLAILGKHRKNDFQGVMEHTIFRPQYQDKRHSFGL